MSLIFDFDFHSIIGSKKDSFRLDVHCQSNAMRLGIMGSSGSGKSMTLHILAGLRKPDSGYITIQKQCYTHTTQGLYTPPQKRYVGIVFQDYALFPHLSIRQNIAFSLKQGWLNPRRFWYDDRVDYWLERMQLSDIADRYPAQLSGGQRQRVVLARVCISHPKWLLLDEPFSALDTPLRQHMRELVASLQHELNIPMIIISHDTADTNFLADEVIFMQNGHLHHCSISM